MNWTIFFRKLIGTHRQRRSVRIQNFDQEKSYIELCDAPGKPHCPLKDISAQGLGFTCPATDEETLKILSDEKAIPCRLVVNGNAFDIAIRVIRQTDDYMVGCILVKGELRQYKKLYNELALEFLQESLEEELD